MKHGAPMLATALLAGIAMAWSPRYWSTGVAIGCICVVAASWAIVSRGLDRSPRLVLTLIAVGAISGWGALQLILHASVAPWLTARASLTWLACGISFFLASRVAAAGKNRRVFLAWLLWGVTALSMEALLQRVQTIFPVEPAIVGTFLYKNHFAAVIEMVAPIALYRGLADPGNRFPGGIAFVVMFAAMVASASRTGVFLLSAELFIAIAVMLSRRALSPRAALSIVAVSTAVLGVAASIAGPERIWEHLHEKNPWFVRGQLLASTIRMTSQRPWLGSGLGTWRLVYPGFATFDTGLLANEAHNDWAEWASEAGLPFMILMASLAIRLAKPAVQSIWGLGVLMVMVHSLVDYPIREPATGLLWFGLAGALSRFEHHDLMDISQTPARQRPPALPKP